MSTSNPIVNNILGDARKRLPVEFIESFEVKTKTDKRLILQCLAQVPFFLRNSVRYKFNRMVDSKSIGLKGAKLFIKDLSEFCKALPVNVTITPKQLFMYVSKVVNLCITYRKQNKCESSLLIQIEKLISSLGLVPRKGKSTKGNINRYCCIKWWIRKLKTLYMQSKERIAHYLGMVNDRLDKYLTTENFKEIRENRLRNKAYFNSLVATDDSGTSIDFSSVQSSSLSNPKNRRAEIITRLKGSEKYAEKYGYIADLITFTCPSRFHSSTVSNFRNKRYDNSSVIEAKDYLNLQWKRLRSRLSKLKIDYYGFRVVEPHHDGTPHWHMVVFTKSAQHKMLNNCLTNYIVGSDPSKEALLNISISDKKKGSVCGYLIKNISHEIDFSGKQNSAEASDEKLLRIYSWGSLWKLHQFEPFGGPKVSMWREARRIALTTQVDDSPIWKIVKEGDWLSFVEFINQPKPDGSKNKISLYKEFDSSLNDFDEERGILVKGLIVEGKTFISRNNWKIKAKSDDG